MMEGARRWVKVTKTCNGSKKSELTLEKVGRRKGRSSKTNPRSTHRSSKIKPWELLVGVSSVGVTGGMGFNVGGS